jgi:hypothetical protein
MSTTSPTPIPMERITSAARAQLDLPDGVVESFKRTFENHIPDVWIANTKGTRGRFNAVLHLAGDRITIPAGLGEAGRVLGSLGVLDKDLNGSLIYVVIAAGGMMPGWPDNLPAPVETKLPGGGMRVTLALPESWLAYAASGGVGPPPPDPGTGGGVRHREPVGEATFELGADRALRWTFILAGKQLGACEAKAAGQPPALSEADLLRVLAVARERTRAPRAMPRTEPREVTPGLVTVELCALGPVHVDLRGRKPADVVGEKDPAKLVALLEATGGLPPGLLASDLSSVTLANGVLGAEVPGPLVAWAAAGARALTPRAPGALLDGVAPRGRIKLDLATSRWTLEPGDGKTP